MLDEQSGTLLPGGNTQFPGRGTFPIETEQRAHYKDAGGASRFFPSFEGQEPPDAPFFYTGKASKRETTLDVQVENTHPCLHPDSLVMTPEGYRPISTLGVGSHVLAADGRFHSVEAVTQHPYTSEALVEIRIAGSNITSLVTDNHPYLVWRPERHKAAIVGGSVHWLRADEIRVGDYTMTPLVLGGVEGVLPPRAEDTEFWFLIGLYLAEGSNRRRVTGRTSTRASPCMKTRLIWWTASACTSPRPRPRSACTRTVGTVSRSWRLTRSLGLCARNFVAVGLRPRSFTPACGTCPRRACAPL